MRYSFHSGAEYIARAAEHHLSLTDVALQREAELTHRPIEDIRAVIASRLAVMRTSVAVGLRGEKRTMGGMGGGDAKKFLDYLASHDITKMSLSPFALRAAAYAIANNENNACMGCIVACPTAGSSGVTPGVLLAAEEAFGYSTDELIDGLIVASAVGAIIAENATVSGAEGGCQAEIGSAAAMAAAALTHLRGGTPEQCLTAATLALKNMLGLACDPIGGMVEVPCIKRNAFAAVYALLGSDLAIAGITSYVPFDEVVEALKHIGSMMSTKIRETALGGLAITATGQATNKRLGIIIKENE